MNNLPEKSSQDAATNAADPSKLEGAPLPDAALPVTNTTGPHQNPNRILPEVNTTGPHQRE